LDWRRAEAKQLNVFFKGVDIAISLGNVSHALARLWHAFASPGLRRWNMMKIQTVRIKSSTRSSEKSARSLGLSAILNDAIATDDAAKHTLSGCGNTVCDLCCDYA
jgi:hypothetical protein